MGCCFSKKNPSTSPNVGSNSIKSSDPNKSVIDKSSKLENEAAKEKLELEESKPRKEVFFIKHRSSHEKSEESPASDEKSTDSNPKPVGLDVDVDAILIQCGRLSRSNSGAAKTRRYSGSKRSFDFDGEAEEADAEDGGEEEAERRIHRQRQRGGESPRERRRRTPSREREDSRSYRSGSKERGSGNGSRRVSRSPGRRSEPNPNPNPSPNFSIGSGNSVNSNNTKPAKFVSVPATEKSNNVDSSTVKRITVKRNIGKVPSPRSQSPARANAQPSPSKLNRKTEHSPYRRNPLGEIDSNSMAPNQTSSSNKRMMNRENENQGLIKESGNLVNQKLSTKTAAQAPIRRTASPNRVTKEHQETVEDCKIVLSSGALTRTRSLRKSRDFDFSPEALLSNNNNVAAAAATILPSYTALLLEDIQNFHQKNVNATSSSSMSKSSVEAVSDLNSTTRTDSTGFKSKKADLMEPSFEKYVTVKRGSSSMEEMEEQESSGSNSFIGTSSPLGLMNSAESSVRSKKQGRDRSPLSVNHEFDPLKKNGVGGLMQKSGGTC